MARNIVGRDNKSEAPPVDKAPEEGGTSGKPEDVSGAEKNIMLPGSRVVGKSALRAPQESDEPVKIAKHYRVKVEGSVMYDGYRSVMRAGKIVSDAHVDIEKLRAQNIQLEECEAPEAAESFSY